MVKLKYSELSTFAFAQAMQKIASTPTHGNAASQIHRVARAVQKGRDLVAKTYQSEIVEAFGKRDSEGKIIRPQGEPMGFEADETKLDQFTQTQEAFGERELVLDKLTPFSVQFFGDIKVSAHDLEALKGLYIGNVEDEDSAVPDNVSSLR